MNLFKISRICFDWDCCGIHLWFSERSGGNWAGLIGLIANPIIYYILSESILSQVHFLYSMSYSLLAVLLILFVYGVLHQRTEKVSYNSDDDEFNEFQGGPCRIGCMSSDGSALCGVLVA